MSMNAAQKAHFYSREPAARMRAVYRLTAVRAYRAYRLVGYGRCLSLSFAARDTGASQGSIGRWLHAVRGCAPGDDALCLFLLLDRRAAKEKGIEA